MDALECELLTWRGQEGGGHMVEDLVCEGGQEGGEGGGVAVSGSGGSCVVVMVVFVAIGGDGGEFAIGCFDDGLGGYLVREQIGRIVR